MAGQLIFRYRSRDSFLCRCNPLAKMILLIGLCAAASRGSLAYAAALIALCLLAMGLSRMPVGRYVGDLWFFLFMGLFIYFGRRSQDGDSQAALLAALRFLCCILLSVLYADTTDPYELAASLGPVLDIVPFVKGYRAAAAVEMTLSLVPLVFQAADRVWDAQKARMPRHSRPVRTLAVLATGIMSEMLGEMENVSDALSSRLYDPDFKRPHPSWSRRDFFLFLCGGIIAAGAWVLP